MKNLQFPIWCVKYLIDNEQLANPKSTIEEVIDCYTGIANTANWQNVLVRLLKNRRL